MEEVHRGGGVPRGWQFAVPPGDAAKGRQLFQDLECFKCHAIKGESFPPSGGDPKSVGPDLTGMGAAHPAEYLAESILAPNHVIVEGPGFTGPDGLSIMPSFADSLSLAQWVDLVAYLKSLTEGGDAPPHGRGVERSQVAGDYRIRIVYEPGASTPHGDGHSGAHGASPSATAAPGHLMAFITDREFNEPVPYLPVTAIVHTPGRPPRTVKLAPMVSDRGFHYGASLALPEGTQKIALSIGATAMQVTGGAKGRFKKPVTAVFE
jgi:mono/diheme cytochrome c family protein